MRERPLTEFLSSEKTTERKENPAKRKKVKGPWELPEGWRWVRLGDVCNEIYRYPSFYGFERLEEGIPVIRIGNINDDGTLSSNRSEYIFIHPEIAHMYPRTLLKEGDLVMGVRGSIGKLAFIDKNFQGAQISPNLIRISPNPEVIHPRYLFRFMWYFTKFVLISKDSPVIPTITAKTIKKFPIPLPPLSEQKRIVAKLDELNKRIEEAKRLAREAREEAEKLMASALHEVFSKAEERGWEWVRLGDVAKIIMGQSPPSDSYNTEGMGLPFYQGSKDFGLIYPTPTVWCTRPYKIAKEGDVLISVRAPVGPVNIANEKCVIGRGIAAVRPLNVDGMFLFYFLKFYENKWTGFGSTFKAIRKKNSKTLKSPSLPSKNKNASSLTSTRYTSAPKSW